MNIRNVCFLKDKTKERTKQTADCWKFFANPTMGFYIRYVDSSYNSKIIVWPN